jgi:oligoendopeptidase F
MAQIVERNKRKYYPEDFIFTDWNSIESYYSELERTEISSLDTLMKFIEQRSEIDKIVEEEYRWRYVHMTCDTENESYKEQYEAFINDVMPQLMPVSNRLNLLVYQSPFFNDLDSERFFIYKRSLKNAIELYKEENVALIQQEQLLAHEFGSISGQMTIVHNDEEFTLPQAGLFLQEKDRAIRKEVYEKINNRRLEDEEKLNQLFSDLVKVRHQIAVNAGFQNYRDYKLAELGRFDYGVQECEAFHLSIQDIIIPIVNKIYTSKKGNLGVETLKPYDLEVEETDHTPLKPYQSEREFIDKSIQCLNSVDAYFANCIGTMDKMEYLDLSSRKGKAPGGYNMTMPEIGIPFIFMNGAGTHRDVEVMVHEAGHAVHSFLMRDLPYNFDGDITSETAELASMSMEFFTYDGLQAFYSEEEKARAIQSHLKGTISMLPWIALIDKFQHWIYTHPEHTVEERTQTWNAMHQQLSSDVIDWSAYQNYRNAIWQKQLHLFEVPFYYIEYGIAQLGAIAMYKNYCENKHKTIAEYKSALSLGYTKTIPDVYKAAGISFNFSSTYVSELASFILSKIEMPS